MTFKQACSFTDDGDDDDDDETASMGEGSKIRTRDGEDGKISQKRLKNSKVDCK